MTKRARYICFEGTEGVGKTTQTQKIVDHLRSQGYKVLQTKEPGTMHAPLTMTLRGIMLDKQHDDQMTDAARELISQAIRSIHIEKVILPALYEYDFIIQDRGILTGLSYGTACGNGIHVLSMLAEYVTTPIDDHLPDGVYDTVVYLRGNVSAGLEKALASKQEFAAGDAMEAKGSSFIETCGQNMDELSDAFNTSVINVDGKGIDQVFKEILNTLDLKE